MTTTMTSSIKEVFTGIKEVFTEAEWDAIYEAMADYQDHGEQETDLAHSVQSKISSLFQD
jgi:hypothetical protein